MPESNGTETGDCAGVRSVDDNARLTWGYATAADIDDFYSGRPRESMRAVVIRIDERPVAIIGLAKEPERDRLFSEYKAEFKPHIRRMAVLRAIKCVMGWVESSKIPVYAISEGTGILEKLGFEQVVGDVWLFSQPQRRTSV
jgi:hypothetical protein